MCESEYNPEDPAFLASREIDRDLSEGERAKLERALAASDALRTDLQRLRTAEALLKRWGTDAPEIDWDAFTATVKARIEDRADDEKLHRVDDLLDRWAEKKIPLDDQRYTAAVMARVRLVDRRFSWRSTVLRMGLPLAAAAALALAVTGLLRVSSAPRPLSVVAIGRPYAAPPTATGQERIAYVAFDRTPLDAARQHQGEPAISLISVGSSTAEAWPEEMPPL